ncbi:MAG: chorismate synthase, partial [Phycisphaerae bacterium]|nr:chorismate synthase [Phycisphaerae bacterium]
RTNDLNCCDLKVIEKMVADLLEVGQAGDTAGGAIEVVVRGVPAGLGEPVFDKLKATISHGLMSIAAMTSLEFGLGKAASEMLGSQWNDQPFVEDGRVRWRTNHAGGFLGGMSIGEDIVVRLSVKPTPTISKEQDTVDMMTMEAKKLEAITRRDITLLPRIYPVAEAMMAIAVTDALFMARGWYGVSKLDPKWEKLTEPKHKGEYTK